MAPGAGLRVHVHAVGSPTPPMVPGAGLRVHVHAVGSPTPRMGPRRRLHRVWHWEDSPEVSGEDWAASCGGLTAPPGTMQLPCARGCDTAVALAYAATRSSLPYLGLKPPVPATCWVAPVLDLIGCRVAVDVQADALWAVLSVWHLVLRCVMEGDLASHAARPDPTPPASKVTLAFGSDTFPVLVGRLRDGDDVEVLHAAVRAALRILPTALNTVKAVEAGALPEFVRLAAHADVGIRRLSSQAVSAALRNATAKRAFVDSGLLEPFKAVVEDSDPTVRGNAATALEDLAYAAPNPDVMAAAGYVPLLVRRAREEVNDSVRAQALRALAKVVNAGSPGQREAVSDDAATGVVVRLLSHSAVEVREEAARVLSLLAFSPEGKEVAVKGGACEELFKLLSDERSPRVRAEAAAAVMGIAVDNDGKQAFLEAGLDPLVDLLDDANPFCRQNAMRAVASIAANPSARQRLNLHGVVATLNRRLERATGREKEILEVTKAAVEWTP